jgi:hypothetical protein
MHKHIFTKKSFILFFIFVMTVLIFQPQQVFAISEATRDLQIQTQGNRQADLEIVRAQEKQEAIKNAQLKEDAKREDCRRRIGAQDAECTFQWNDAISLDRIKILNKCTEPFYACMNAESEGGTEMEIECRRKLYTDNGGKCGHVENMNSTACTDYYNACLEKAKWDAAAIAAALSGKGSAGGTTNGYPVRMTPDEYAKLNTPIPYCAFTYEGCRNTDDLITLLVNIGKMIFSVIGVLAFVMFIYGGFTMILAMGNPEKFKKGMQILVAAVTGIIISLSAYLLINFLLTALGVGVDFRAL